MGLFRRSAGLPNITRYVPQPVSWFTGAQVLNLGVGGPRTTPEFQGNEPRVWPAVYRVPCRGLGAMPVFAPGFSDPVFNNQYASGYMPGYNTMIPGMGKTPFGG